MAAQTGRRAVVVEDDALVGDLLQALLEQIGCSVAGIAAGGLQAIDMVQQLRPDVVLMDVKLPELDGIETARRIAGCCPTPIVVVTAYDVPGLLERITAAGVGAYLTKPPNARDLERAIAVAVARFEDLMALRRLNERLESEIAQREQAEQAAQRRSRELELLYQAGQAFGATLDLDRVLVAVLEQARQLLGAMTCVIGLIDPETGEMVCRQAAGFSQEIACGQRLAPGQGLCGWTAQHGESLLVTDAQADARYYTGFEQSVGVVLRSFLSVPLRTRQGVIGVLQAADTQAGRFSPSDLRLLETLAVSAAAAVENAQLYAAVRQELEQRRETEQVLRHSERNLAKAQCLGHLGNWDWDVAGNVLAWSDEVYRIFGVDRDFALTYASIEALVHPDDRLKNAEAVQNLLDTADAAELELRIVRPDGELRHIVQRVEVSRAADGTVVRLFGTIQDVTERKQIEDALRRREQEFQALVERSPDIITRFDRDLRHVYISPAIEAASGLPTQAFIGRTNRELGMPDALAVQWEAALRQVFESRQAARIEFAFPSPGGLRYYESHLVPEADEHGEVGSVLGVNRDITDRKRADEALQYQASLLETVDDAVISVDMDFRIRSWNRGAEAVYGWRAEEVLGRSVREVNRVEYPSHRWEESVQQFLATGRWKGEVVEQHKDGRALNIMAAVVLLKDDAGRPVGAVSVNRDITERKQMEQTLRKSETGYRRLAQENADLLEQARQDAAIKAHLLQEVNHRVRNNLSTLISLLYAERRYARADDPAGYRDQLTELAGRVESWALVQDALSAGGWSSLRLDELVRQVIEASQKVVPHGKCLEVEVAPSDVQMPSREAHSMALLINELATNTIKYALGPRPAARVRVAIAVEGETVCLEYRDDGPGYPEDALRMERHGLGLHLLKALVGHDLQGELALHNDGGAVTCIRFGLPSG